MAGPKVEYNNCFMLRVELADGSLKDPKMHTFRLFPVGGNMDCWMQQEERPPKLHQGVLD